MEQDISNKELLKQLLESNKRIIGLLEELAKRPNLEISNIDVKVGMNGTVNLMEELKDNIRSRKLDLDWRNNI